MTTTHRFLIPIVFLFAGCGGSATNNPEQSTAMLKAKAAQALAAGQGSPGSDPCADSAWYGDGTCDSFCPTKDTDCVPSGRPVVCAEFSTAADGTCSRASDDPCASVQDPDCKSSAPFPPGSPGALPASCAGVACAEISEVPDKVCSRPADDCCRFQDPDCLSVSEPPPSEPSCAAVACAAYVEDPDNVCSRPVTDCCRSQDPDCSSGGGSGGSGGGSGGGGSGSGGGVACAEYIELPDGKCSRADGDPCRFQDPDCGSSASAYSCDLSTIMCKRSDPGPCPKGEARSVENGCYGQCVAEKKCYPVACALYVEAPDNVCSRPANDPCKGQDPDCTMSSPAP